VCEKKSKECEQRNAALEQQATPPTQPQQNIASTNQELEKEKNCCFLAQGRWVFGPGASPNAVAEDSTGYCWKPGTAFEQCVGKTSAQEQPAVTPPKSLKEQECCYKAGGDWQAMDCVFESPMVYRDCLTRKLPQPRDTKQLKPQAKPQPTPKEKCAPNEEIRKGRCQCKKGYKFELIAGKGQCIEIQCSEEEDEELRNGVCECRPGFMRNWLGGGACVPTCPKGKVWDFAASWCVCPTGTTEVEGSSECRKIACDPRKNEIIAPWGYDCTCKPGFKRAESGECISAALACEKDEDCAAVCQGKGVLKKHQCSGKKCVVKELIDCRQQTGSSCVALRSGSRCSHEVKKELKDISESFKTLNRRYQKLTENRRKLVLLFLNNIAKINVKFWKEALTSVNVPAELSEFIREKGVDVSAQEIAGQGMINEITAKLKGIENLSDAEIIALQAQTMRLMDTRLQLLEKARDLLLRRASALRAEHTAALNASR
jgi:hypothetical protein